MVFLFLASAFTEKFFRKKNQQAEIPWGADVKDETSGASCSTGKFTISTPSHVGGWKEIPTKGEEVSIYLDAHFPPFQLPFIQRMMLFYSLWFTHTPGSQHPRTTFLCCCCCRCFLIIKMRDKITIYHSFNVNSLHSPASHCVVVLCLFSSLPPHNLCTPHLFPSFSSHYNVSPSLLLLVVVLRYLT